MWSQHHLLVFPPSENKGQLHEKSSTFVPLSFTSSAMQTRYRHFPDLRDVNPKWKRIKKGWKWNNKSGTVQKLNEHFGVGRSRKGEESWAKTTRKKEKQSEWRVQEGKIWKKKGRKVRWKNILFWFYTLCKFIEVSQPNKMMQVVILRYISKDMPSSSGFKRDWIVLNNLQHLIPWKALQLLL